MYVEYHVGGTETNGGIRMSGAIVEHLIDGEMACSWAMVLSVMSKVILTLSLIHI